jgi:hypothetical protein
VADRPALKNVSDFPLQQQRTPPLKFDKTPESSTPKTKSKTFIERTPLKQLHSDRALYKTKRQQNREMDIL